MKKLIFLICIFFVSILAQLFAASLNNTSPLGTNIGHVVDWSTEWVFIDTFKMSRTWISQQTGIGWGLGPTLSLDSDGWVTALCATCSADALMIWAGSKSGAVGEYIVLYDGEGTIQTPWDTITSSTPGRIVFNHNPVNPDSGVILKISATNPLNYIRNIRVIRPGFETTYQTQTFHPLFLDNLRNYKVIRFMDWQETNNSPLVNWADRTTVNKSTQTGKNGVALEYQIALANELNADAWFTIPHLASDDFVQQFAQMVKDQLNPNLKAYIEYSNEVWNNQFQQATYARTQGLALGLSTNTLEAQLRYYSKRSVEVFDIWGQVFGSTPRLVRVLATQASNSWTSTTVLDWNNAKLKTDALAIAPYFCGSAGVGDVTAILAMTVDQLLDYCSNQITTTTKGWMDSQQAVVTARGLPMIAYEGGQHLAGVGANTNNQTLTDLFIATNRHPRMKDLYTTYLNQWKTAGGKMFANFSSVGSPSKYGSWCILEYQNQDIATAPKYQAVMDFITANPTSVTPPISSTKAITAFSFTTPSATGLVNETNKTVAVIVPSGTSVTALVPDITTTGSSVSPASGTAQNFTSPVVYIVVAVDGSTQVYTVTVTLTATVATTLCYESWTCGAWSNCSEFSQYRTCTDVNNCGTSTYRPVVVQSCSIPVVTSTPDVSTLIEITSVVPTPPIVVTATSTITTTSIPVPTGVTISNPPTATAFMSVQIRNLQVLNRDNSVITENGTSTRTVIFKALVFDTSYRAVKLEVELRKAGESFTNTPTDSSGYVISGSTILFTKLYLTPGSYNFQARAHRNSGNTSGTSDVSDWLPFGSISITDFTVVSSGVATSKPLFSSSLTFGMSGNDVKKLQSFLSSDKTIYPEGLITGYFGPATRRAVKRFQSIYNLATPAQKKTVNYGGVGVKTMAKMDEIWGD